MTFEFDAEIGFDFKFDYINLYKSACNRVLDIEKCPYECVVSLILTDDNSIQEINKDTRGINKSTDVLSFPMIDYNAPADFSTIDECCEFFDPDSGELILGDIVLSYDHILSQADEYGHSIEREYTFLIIHSMLHLLGYDHMEEDERRIMESRQKIIIESLYNDFPELIVNNVD